MANVTPMMQQYLDIKERYPGMILFFRLGDFYEMFFDDAITVSRELELTLTGKDCGLQERAPMCGVPYHAAETYINRLIGLGHKVAICEQLEDPALCKGLVKRDVIRIVTPGTVVEQSMLSERRNSYILALCADGKRAGVAFADVSTGEFFTYESDASRLADELARIVPREIIADEGAMALADSLGAQVPVSPYAQGAFRLSSAKEALLHHFHVASLDVFGLRDLKMAARAAGALMRYLGDTQKNALEHIATLRLYRREQYMALDRTARRNLELTESLRGERKGSLLALLDKTATSMGGRTLRAWIEQPLCVRDDIERRLDAVAELKDDPMMAQSLFEELRGVYDVERLLSRVSYRSINARDCLALGASLSRIPQVRALIEESHSAMLRELLEQLDPVEDVRDLLLCAINPDAPLLISEGNIIREGYNEELDRLRRASKEGVQWVAELEAKEREETGIKNLRIRYNKVFGYYIEVTKSNYAQVPYRYTRKQTLANSERYVTPELHELEEQIRDEAARAALTDMIVYIRSANISAYNQELVRRDIWQMIADGERRGESVEEIIGGDYKAFCDSVIAELPQLSPAERLLSQLRDTLLSAVVLLAIWLAFDILEQLIKPGTLPYLTVTAGNAVSALLILAAAFMLVGAVSKHAFELGGKPKKRELALLFALIFVLLLVCTCANVFIKYALFEIHALAAALCIAALYGLYRLLDAKLD